MCESVESDGGWFGGAVEVSGLGSSARRGVVTERCFANAWKCVEQDDSVYPSIRSSRGGGAKRGRAWLKTVNVTLALGSDRFMMGATTAELRLSVAATPSLAFTSIVNRSCCWSRG